MDEGHVLIQSLHDLDACDHVISANPDLAKEDNQYLAGNNYGPGLYKVVPGE
jgi:hypothetical protein